MGSHGIKDQVAIVDMGCAKFTEHWDKGIDELLVWSTARPSTLARYRDEMLTAITRTFAILGV